jgi:outer membrane protein TolC
LALKRGPLSDAEKQAIKDGMARRKAGAPTKKERAAAAKEARALVPTLTASGAIRRQQCIHRYPDDGSDYRTFREIGEGLGVTKNAVNMCYNRAMRKIAEELVLSQRVDGMEPAELAIEKIMSMQALEELIIEALQSSVARPDHRSRGYRSVS